MRAVSDVDTLLRAGADKVGVNTAAIARPELIAEIAERFGRQVLDAVAGRAAVARTRPSRLRGDHARRPARHRHRRGRVGAPRAPSWARARSCSTRWTATAPRTASTSTLIAAVRAAVDDPGDRLRRRRRAWTHFPPAVAAGADAVLAASVFHFGELTIGEVKGALRDAGHPVR